MSGMYEGNENVESSLRKISQGAQSSFFKKNTELSLSLSFFLIIEIVMCT